MPTFADACAGGGLPPAGAPACRAAHDGFEALCAAADPEPCALVERTIRGASSFLERNDEDVSVFLRTLAPDGPPDLPGGPIPGWLAYAAEWTRENAGPDQLQAPFVLLLEEGRPEDYTNRYLESALFGALLLDSVAHRLVFGGSPHNPGLFCKAWDGGDGLGAITWRLLRALVVGVVGLPPERVPAEPEVCDEKGPLLPREAPATPDDGGDPGQRESGPCAGAQGPSNGGTARHRPCAEGTKQQLVDNPMDPMWVAALVALAASGWSNEPGADAADGGPGETEPDAPPGNQGTDASCGGLLGNFACLLEDILGQRN